ncbi:hypothetical protein JCM8547_004341 [Rhodosporidiobolus lusitaniae]
MFSTPTRGLSKEARAILAEAYLNRAQLGLPAGGFAFWDALAAHVQAKAPSDPPITRLQVQNAIGYMRRHGQLNVAPAQLAQEGLPDPYEPVAAPEGEERPTVLHHPGMMFSGSDLVVVPNYEVHYDEHRHLYVDSQGQTVTPHWLDDVFF